MPSSTVLQQSLNEMQHLQSQQSFYSDPSSKRFSPQTRSSHNTDFVRFSATSTVHNRSMAPKPLINTSFLSPLHTTVSVQPNASIVQGSFLNGGVSKADIPYRSLAQFGVLSKYSSDHLLFALLNYCFSVQTSHSNLWLLGSSMFHGILSPSPGLARRSTSGYECLLFIYAWSKNERSTPLTDAERNFSLPLFSVTT